MPEYLAPGVYVEEVSFRSKSIEGVSTTTTAFVGPTRYGPAELVPDVITSLVEFERIYGDRQQIVFAGSPRHNYMWHAVRQFFENQGKRCYIARVFRGGTTVTLSSPPASPPSDELQPGHAVAVDAAPLWVRARFPGAGGNMRVRITLTAGTNVFTNAAGTKSIRGVVDRDAVVIDDGGSADLGKLFLAESFISAGQQKWRFNRGGTQLDLSAVTTSVRVVTATVIVIPPDPNIPTWVYPDLALDSLHRRNGAKDSITDQFAAEQPSLGRARSIPIVIDTSFYADGIELLDHLLSTGSGLRAALVKSSSSDDQRAYDFELTGGSDGDEPEVGEYEGKGAADPTSKEKSGLKALEDIDEISIVAAPGSTLGYESNKSKSQAIIGAVISHAERMRYRIAVIDSGDKQSVGDVRDMRGKIDSTYAAFYYPWITVNDPVTREDINLPPSGAVTGIYARNDINRGVFKAPANEVVDGAIGLETILNKSQQDILNPLGVNCFRFFEGRGYRLWGARTATSDPEWKYVNLRRYFAFLEHSIDKGTQWAVFEPNGERLWSNIRITISDFLFNEWTNGALLGDKAEKAFFVKCDRSTMTQNDLDNGRLVCLVGVAALKPAEYVIIRIGQWTADRKV
jgi:phage tail sheath protein FI